MHVMDKKICFGVIVATRGFFNPVFAGTARRRSSQLLDELAIEYVIGSEDATPHGTVETLEDAKLYAGLFRENAEKIDGVVVILPNFGDELAVVQTMDLAGVDVPVMVQACDDEMDKVSAGT